MSLDRREFLKAVALGVGGLAFAPVQTMRRIDAWSTNPDDSLERIVRRTPANERTCNHRDYAWESLERFIERNPDTQTARDLRQEEYALAFVQGAVDEDAYVGNMREGDSTRLPRFLEHFGNPNFPGRGLFNRIGDLFSRAQRLYQQAIQLRNSGREREAYYTLGRVAHLVQDLGNPEHVLFVNHGPRFETVMCEEGTSNDPRFDRQSEVFRALESQQIGGDGCSVIYSGSPLEKRGRERLLQQILQHNPPSGPPRVRSFGELLRWQANDSANPSDPQHRELLQRNYRFPTETSNGSYIRGETPQVSNEDCDAILARTARRTVDAGTGLLELFDGERGSSIIQVDVGLYRIGGNRADLLLSVNDAHYNPETRTIAAIGYPDVHSPLTFLICPIDNVPNVERIGGATRMDRIVSHDNRGIFYTYVEYDDTPGGTPRTELKFLSKRGETTTLRTTHDTRDAQYLVVGDLIFALEPEGRRGWAFRTLDYQGRVQHERRIELPFGISRDDFKLEAMAGDHAGDVKIKGILSDLRHISQRDYRIIVVDGLIYSMQQNEIGFTSREFPVIEIPTHNSTTATIHNDREGRHWLELGGERADGFYATFGHLAGNIVVFGTGVREEDGRYTTHILDVPSRTVRTTRETYSHLDGMRHLFPDGRAVLRDGTDPTQLRIVNLLEEPLNR